MIMLRWLFSARVRDAVQMRRHAWKMLCSQRDILKPEAIAAVEAVLEDVSAACRNGSKDQIKAAVAQLEKTANERLHPYPLASWRENVEVLLVAIAVAMGIRTFFLQPFKIPTGSMQPTLYGVEAIPMAPEEEIPNRLTRFWEHWVNGVSYEHVVARAPGTYEGHSAPTRLAIISLRQKFRVGGEEYTLNFPTDSMLDNLANRGFWRNPDGSMRQFNTGDTIMKLRVISGDHLFVDRLTYNFRPPRRGEIIVFETKDIPGLPPDQFYIKRLVALGAEEVKIGDDRHVSINGKRLDSATPRFENVYAFQSRPQDSVYSGHLNGTVGATVGRPQIAPLFPDERSTYTVRPDHYMVMGDNTVNSYDSRAWGDFPRERVIGKANFVYWPITRRFGLGYR